MSTVIITITDDEDAECITVKVDFDPGVKTGDIMPPASAAAMRAVDAITDWTAEIAQLKGD